MKREKRRYLLVDASSYREVNTAYEQISRNGVAMVNRFKIFRKYNGQTLLIRVDLRYAAVFKALLEERNVKVIKVFGTMRKWKNMVQ